MKALLVVLMLAGNAFACDREPSYKGASRSEWQRLSKDSDPQTADNADKALSAMGDAEAKKGIATGRPLFLALNLTKNQCGDSGPYSISRLRQNQRHDQLCGMNLRWTIHR